MDRAACQLLKHLRPIDGNLGNISKILPLELQLSILKDIDGSQILTQSQCESIQSYAQDRATLKKTKGYFIREAVYKVYSPMLSSLSHKRMSREALPEALPAKKRKHGESFESKRATPVLKS